MKTTYTYDDLSEDVKQRIKETHEASRLIRRGVEMLQTRTHIYPHEAEALQSAVYAADCVTNRVAASALTALRVRTGKEV
jgi:hypothetical protein